MRATDNRIQSIPAPAGLIYRVAKYEVDPFEPAPWQYVGSNRFDDPEAEFRIIYCASDRVAAYGETLARYRRSVRLLALMQEVDDSEETIEEALAGLIDPADEQRGVVPLDWRFKRRIGTTRLNPTLRFADIAHMGSIEHLRESLAPRAAAAGLPDFDIGTVLSTGREMPQYCARYIYEMCDDQGKPLFAGIRYPSRLNLEWSCWAIFDDRIEHDPKFNEFHDPTIDPKDPDLLKILRLFNLSLEGVRGSGQYIRG